MGFLLLTAKLLFCWDKSYKIDERMTIETVKRVGNSENILLSLGNPREWKKILLGKATEDTSRATCYTVLQIPSDKKTFQRNTGQSH